MKWRTPLLAMSVSVALLPVGAAPASAEPADTHELQLTPVVSGLSVPLDLRAPEGSKKLFIVELTGKIRIFKDGKLKKKPFLNMSSKISTGGERGLLGLAFHPNYDKNGLFYIYYTDPGGDVRISEFSVSTNSNLADADSERILLEINEPYSNHNGGGLAFGPSGYLYISVGDGGSGGDPEGNGQNISTLLGSLLRIDVDGQSGGNEYAIPPENPFVSGAGRDEIFAYGLRNPWRMSIDQVSGRIYIGDVGQGAREEVDVIPETGGGTNFGWNVMEGTNCYQPPSGCDKSGKKLPVVDYPNPQKGSAVIGGYVYRGHSMPWLRGTYFYSDLSGRRLKSFRLVSGKAKERNNWTSQVGRLPSSVYGFGQDGFGELYVLSGSTVYRIEETDAAKCDFNGDGDDDLAAGVPGENVAGSPNAGAVSILPATSGKPSGSGDKLWSQHTPGVSDAVRKKETMGKALACGDFDGDGFDDLAVGTPRNKASGIRSGAVNIFHGSPGGLKSTALLRQGEDGVNGTAQNGDLFGAALSSGDFDGDGFGDLAVGVPGEDVGGLSNAGRVNVIYGSSKGLTGGGDLSLTQDTPGVKGAAAKGDRFGSALAAGDFDGNGFADIAIGAPGDDVGGDAGAGLVNVLFGRRNMGISTAGDVKLTQDTPGSANAAQTGDEFGVSLAAAPVDSDGFDDLLVGAPGDTVNGLGGAGLVHYFPGSKKGPSTNGDRVVDLGTAGIAGSPAQGDGFGSSLDSGDVNGDGFADIAVGIPFKDIDSKDDAGAAAVIYGAKKGPLGGSAFFSEGTAGVKGVPQAHDRFGHDVALLDFEKDGRLDLAIGMPFEEAGGKNDGVVAILFGRVSGIVVAGDIRVDQGTPGVSGTPQKGDMFGWSIGG